MDGKTVVGLQKYNSAWTPSHTEVVVTWNTRINTTSRIRLRKVKVCEADLPTALPALFFEGNCYFHEPNFPEYDLDKTVYCYPDNDLVAAGTKWQYFTNIVIAR